MANKVIDSDLQVKGQLTIIPIIIDGIVHQGLFLSGEGTGGDGGYIHVSRTALSFRVGNSAVELELGKINNAIIDISATGGLTIGGKYAVWEVRSKKFIVPNGTASQFMKADGSLDSTTYAQQADLNSVKNNAWKLDVANAEVSTVVIALQGDMSVFAAMDKAGINYQTSRNIYVDMSEADSTITDIFAGWESLPVGVRYHIFFGNTKNDCKINWNESKVESNIIPSLGLTPAYPTAKCEFMRVTDQWTYADWEAKVENVNFTIDTGTASESDNSTLMNYMDNNKISYEKTTNGALVNIIPLLAALVGNGK